MPTFGKNLKTGSPDVLLKVQNGELRLRFMLCLAAEMDAGHPVLPMTLAPALLQVAKDAVATNLAHAATEHARATRTAPAASGTVAPTSTGSNVVAGPTTTAPVAAGTATTSQTPTVTSQTPTVASQTPCGSGDSGPGTPPTPAVAPNASANGPENWESDNSSLWGDSDDDL